MINLNCSLMKTLLLLAAFVAFSSLAKAVDTTPPTLNITHAWIEKVGSVVHFKMLLDPQDETGFSPLVGPPPTNTPGRTIEFRSKLNSTAALPANTPWNTAPYPWIRGQPFDIPFNCTSVVFELRAVDAAGNVSPLQRRTFASPFPFSPPPNLTLRITDGVVFDGPIADCRGLFAGNLNGDNKDDLLQLDRVTGDVVAMQTGVIGYARYVAMNLGANMIEDSVGTDLDGDGDLDFAVVLGGGLGIYINTGPDLNGLVQFNASVPAIVGTGITTVQHVTAGDITGEGKRELIISGIADDGMGGTITRIGWLLNDAIWSFNAANGTVAPVTTGTGRLAVGDMNGDGQLDLVMIDTGNNQLVIFKNKGSALAGADDVDTAIQPQLISTGLANGGPPPSVVPLIPLPGQSIAIADVTGDGKLDVVITMHALLRTNPFDPNDGRNQEYWRLYENRGSTFKPQAEVLVGQSPTSTSTALDFPSDVLLQDLNQDHFPEVIVTNFYGNSLQATRFTPQLNNINQVISFEIDSLDYVPVPDFPDPAYTQPSRLASGNPFPSSSGSLGSIGVTFAGSGRTMWNENISRPSSKPADIVGGTITNSDDTGVEGANGLRTYSAFVGGKITSTLTAINNSAAELTNVFLDVILPTNCSLDTGFTDPGWAPVTIGTVKYARWTVTVPANDVVIKSYRLNILNGAVNTPITSTAFLRRSNTSEITSSLMPKVVMNDPIQFRATVETESDNSGGDTAYAEEWIKYRMKMTNQSGTTVTGKDLVFTLPANTTHLDHSADSVLGVTPVIKVGGTAYSPWKPNATIALSQKVIGSNNHLYQCTANGISGLTEPVWNNALNALTNDGPVVWKQIAATPAALTSFTWSGFDLPPDDPEITTDDIVVEVKVKIKAGLANGTKITSGLTTFTRSDGTALGVKQTAAAWITTLLNPLEITLGFNKTIARPGEVVRYTFTVHNRAFIALGNCKVVDVVPPGMIFVQSGASDGADSAIIGGTGNFNQFPGYIKNNLTPTSLPISLDVLNILTWNLGTIPGRTTRQIEFDVQVQQDVPTDYYTTGVLHPMELSNFSYNFVGNNTAGKRLFALKPTLGESTGSAQGAASLFLVAGNTPRRTLLSADTPLDAPNISLLKTFDGDGRQEEGGETVDYLINDTIVTTDGIGRYALNFDNRGTGYARNVVIRDYLPTGMTFKGSLVRDGSPVTNFTGFHFYDSTGKLLVQTDAFTDTNANGFADAGEAFTDTNGNGKFDGFTAAVVRSMDLFAGNVAGTTAGYLSYQVQTTLAPGAIILSTAGGMSGVKDGLSFTALTGYHLKADNLRFPINGSPKQVKVVITVPAQITMPLDTVKSRSGAQDNEATTITIPYEVKGAVGLTMSGLKMEFDIPKGYSILGAQVLNTLGAAIKNFIPGGVANTITVTTNATSGISHITFPLDGNRIAWPMLQIAVNAAAKAALLDAKGQTKAPMTFKPVMTGSYTKPVPPAPPAPHFSATSNGFSAAAPPPPAPIALPAVSSLGTLPVLVDSTKDSRIFVGRCAPVAVTRYTSFNYTIFVGNLSSLPLGVGTITMKIPAGCEGLSMTRYSYNALNTSSPPDSGGKFGNVLPVIPAPVKLPGISKTPTNGVYDALYTGGAWTKFTWNKPLAAGTTVTWDVGSFFPSEGGVATLTVRVLESFTGDRIDDNTCVFDVENACARTAGPSSIAVRVGTEGATSASLGQRALEGMQVRTSTGVMNTLGQSFQLGEQSCHISVGGADVLQLTNGVAAVPMPGDRVLVAGPPASVQANGNRLVLDHPMMRVAVGPGSISGGVQLIDVPSYNPGVINANSLLTGLIDLNANIVAGGGGNIVAGGGGNIVAGGGGNFQEAGFGGANPPSIVRPEGLPAIPVATLHSNGDAKLIGDGGGTLIGDGGGTLIPATGGHIFAASGGKVLANDGASVISNDGAGVLANDGASLIGQDGAGIVAGGGMNLISVNSGMLVKGGGFTQGLGK